MRPESALPAGERPRCCATRAVGRGHIELAVLLEVGQSHAYWIQPHAEIPLRTRKRNIGCCLLRPVISVLMTIQVVARMDLPLTESGKSPKSGGS